MTIKELCIKAEKCSICPFERACNLLQCIYPSGIHSEIDKSITKSIIKTAKALQEDNND